MRKDVIKIVVSILLFVSGLAIVLFSGYFDYGNNILKKDQVSDIEFSKNKVNIYMFWGDGCPHCEEMSKYLSKLNKKYGDNYNLYTLEVWKNDENNKLMKSITEKLNVDSKGVPFLVVGDKYFIGFSSANEKDIEKAIIKYYNSKEKIDIYKNILSEK